MQAGHCLCIRLVHLMLCATRIKRFAVSKLHTESMQRREYTRTDADRKNTISSEKFVRRAQ